MTPSKSDKETARQIVRKEGGICLVPKSGGHGGISCHEKTFCDCTVEELIAKAIAEAYERGARENKTADSYFERLKAKAKADQREMDAKIAENYPASSKFPFGAHGSYGRTMIAAAIRRGGV